MTATNQPIDLNPTHLETIQCILKEHVPDCEVRAFGSRAKWNARDYSDLDLAVVGQQPQGWQVLNRLETAFRESNLPFKVDVLDWHDISDRFKKIIQENYVILSKPINSISEWKQARLGDIANVSWGDTSTTKSKYTKSGFLAYSAKGPDGYLPYADYSITGIVLSAIGADCGKTWLAKGQWSCIKNTIRFWSTDPEIDTEFLYWITRDPSFWPKRGSAQPFISQGDARNLMISYPPLEQQRSISHILGTLDDKIELNRHMNETLESMAQALFKSWFVDFDPVRAKMDGRWRPGESLPGLPAHLYDLFPDRLIPSELGDIPEGWKVQKLGKVIELAYGKSLKADKRNSGLIPVYGSNGQVGWHNKKLVDGPGIIVGRKGNPGTVKLSYSDFFPIDTTFYVIPKFKELGFTFLYFSLAGQDLPSISSDSAVPGLNRESAYMNRQLTPNQKILKKFNYQTIRIFIQRYLIEQETHKIRTIRDTLLSKLMQKI